MQAKKIFITVESDYWKAIDYPQNAPIPRIGETCFCNGMGGKVLDIRHTLQDDVLIIRIITA